MNFLPLTDWFPKIYQLIRWHTSSYFDKLGYYGEICESAWVYDYCVNFLLPAFRLDQLLKTLGGPFCHNATITRVKPPLRGHCSCPQRNEHLFIEPVYTDTRPAMIESTFSVCVRGCVCVSVCGSRVPRWAHMG